MTKALITGITGMVGSHLLDHLHANTDWQIDGMIRWRSPLDNIAHHAAAINDGRRIKLHYADLTDSVSVDTMVRNSKPPSQNWRTFLENHAKEIVSIDFFTVPAATFWVLRLFVFLVLSKYLVSGLTLGSVKE